MLPTVFPGQHRYISHAQKTAPRAAAWSDRRPIGILQFADHSLVNARDNPDGYFPPVVSNQNGYVGQALDRAVKLGCQGALFYDAEGQREPVPVTYKGRPFNGVSSKIGKTTIRAWCKQADDRGLWVGFCFRSTLYVPGAQVRTTSPATTVGSEFNAARDYYGKNVKGIYWDTNIKEDVFESKWQAEPLHSDWLTHLRNIIGPDVLVMTEFTGPGYDKAENVAAIRFFDGQKLGPSKGSPIEILVPPTTPPTPAQRQDYVDAMKMGGICWTTISWDAEDTKWIPGAYDEAHGVAKP